MAKNLSVAGHIGQMMGLQSIRAIIVNQNFLVYFKSILVHFFQFVRICFSHNFMQFANLIYSAHGFEKLEINIF